MVSFHMLSGWLITPAPLLVVGGLLVIGGLALMAWAFLASSAEAERQYKAARRKADMRRILEEIAAETQAETSWARAQVESWKRR